MANGLGNKSDKQKLSEDEAEDWQNTRAARRVSLANLPHGHMRELSKRLRGRTEDAEGSPLGPTTFDEDAPTTKDRICADGEMET